MSKIIDTDKLKEFTLSKRNLFVVFTLILIFTMYNVFYWLFVRIYFSPKKSTIIDINYLGEANLELIIFTILNLCGFIVIPLVIFEELKVLKVETLFNKIIIALVFLICSIFGIWFAITLFEITFLSAIR
ncbi:MAG: hypothetical protein ACFE9L_09190 [Candidatus Hodarchaeota archaeon]